jgi:hypothetical protein
MVPVVAEVGVLDAAVRHAVLSGQELLGGEHLVPLLLLQLLQAPLQACRGKNLFFKTGNEDPYLYESSNDLPLQGTELRSSETEKIF